MANQNESIYPISVVMSMTQLTARQIRYYETNGLIKPARSKGNQRLYTQTDVENLTLIKSLLEKGLNLDGIRAVLIGGGTPAESAVPSSATPHQSNLYSPQQVTPRLTSLYPVNNQEALNSWLQRKRK